MRAYGADCSTPSRGFSSSATSDDGSTDATTTARITSQATPTAATAHHRRRGGTTGVGAVGGGNGGVSVDDMSWEGSLAGVVGSFTDSTSLGVTVEEITTRAAAMVGLAIVALVLTGWRKTARVEQRRPRGPAHSETDRAYRYDRGVVVDHDPGRPYRRPGPLRRLLALVGSGAIGVLVGVLTAIITAYAVAYAVIELTDLLQQ